jgi:hypothetical protein
LPKYAFREMRAEVTATTRRTGFTPSTVYQQRNKKPRLIGTPES